jgi:nitroimidazol reductase NimA-like FMN-containing flavoprotein (pyridoxamine 5'-phosphate oxidase superfamily)
MRDMRRNNQLLSQEDTEAVMFRGTNGVLACLGDEDYPYAVPVSYVYYKNILYFHCAKEGHKIDAISRNPKVSFAVIDEDTVESSKFTTCFRSVIAFGKARIVQGEEWLEAFAALVEKYSGDQSKEVKRRKIAGCEQSHIIAVDIVHMTGKEAIEFVHAKRPPHLPTASDS